MSSILSFCIFLSIVLMLVSALSLWLKIRSVALEESRRVITPKLLYDTLSREIGGKKQLDFIAHPVYDFENRRILVLRSNGRETRVAESYAIPNTLSYHVRFDSPAVFNERYRKITELHSNQVANRVSNVATMIDRNKLLDTTDRLFANSRDAIRAWGGAKLSLIYDEKTNVVVLRFNGRDKTSESSRSSVTVRLPKYLKCETDVARQKIRFTARTPCSIETTRSAVKYGDYLTYYVAERSTASLTAAKIPNRDSPQYRRVIPYFQWICKSSEDTKPKLAVK